MTEEFRAVKEFAVLRDDESDTLAIRFGLADRDLAVTLTPKQACDLVARMFFTAALQSRTGSTVGPPDALMPIDINGLTAWPGRSPTELLLEVSAGQLALLFAVDLDLAVQVFATLFRNITRDEEVGPLQ